MLFENIDEADVNIDTDHCLFYKRPQSLWLWWAKKTDQSEKQKREFCSSKQHFYQIKFKSLSKFGGDTV